MPELPEVEVSRLSIDAPLRGARVTGVRLGKPLRHPLGIEPAELVGLYLGPVRRRGKYLWLPLLESPRSNAAAAPGLLLHLGMSGSLRLLQQALPPAPHDHFELQTTRGQLRLNDPRRFGAVIWSSGLAHPPASDRLAGLGAEPFDPALTAEVFHAALRQRKGSIKSVLLSGKVVVGAGNIYACEALHAAGIDPRTSACRLRLPRARRLLSSLQSTLQRALSLGGSTLRDFRDAHGASGAYQATAAVYAREGLACPGCGTAVRRIVQQQRSTYFCPRCQRR